MVVGAPWLCKLYIVLTIRKDADEGIAAPLYLSQPYVFTHLVAKFECLDARLKRFDHPKAFS